MHVHEPFAPSASPRPCATRARSTWAPSTRPPSACCRPRWRARSWSSCSGRLDGRTASFAATRELMQRYFPGDYRVIRPGADLLRREADGAYRTSSSRPRRSAAPCGSSCARCASCPPELDWRATIWLRDSAAAAPPALPRRLRDRVRWPGRPTARRPSTWPRGDRRGGLGGHRARAAAGAARPGRRRGAGGLAAAPVRGGAARGRARACCSSRATRDTLAAQLERLLLDPGLAERYRKRIDARRTPTSVGPHRRGVRGALCGEIAGAPARRGRQPAVRKRLAKREFIHVDLHMHTDHSHDCATPVDTLLAAAKDAGLGAIAVTDHNEVSGALEARERANGIKVIVAEEVKTADQGEVIGLFIEEKIPRGMTLQETIAEIRRQGGLVYVPHPFDRMHSVPDYEHLLDVVEDVDAIEVFNPRVAFTAFNEEAERFAAKYRIVAGAGSDSHVAAGLGSVKIRMRDFDGPEEFLESLRDADIVRKPASLLYVQALKFLQTKATPAGARAGPPGPAPARPGQARGDAGKRSGGGSVKTLRPGAGHRRRDPREVPRARDPRAEPAHARAAGVRALPARQPDARARLGASAGRHLHAQVRARGVGDRGGRGLLRPRRQRADEELQAPRHRSAGRVRHGVREVPGGRHRPVGARVPRARAGRAGDRAAAHRGGDGRGGARRS